MLQKNRNYVANNQFTIKTIWKIKGKPSLPLFISFLLLLFRIFRVLLLPTIVTGLHLLLLLQVEVQPRSSLLAVSERRALLLLDVLLQAGGHWEDSASKARPWALI